MATFISPLFSTQNGEFMSANLHVSENTLSIKGDLYWEQEEEFDNSVRTLMSQFKNFVIDLTGVDFIFSSFMGRLAALHFECRGKDINMHIKISPQHEKVFHLAGFSKILDIEVIYNAVPPLDHSQH